MKWLIIVEISTASDARVISVVKGESQMENGEGDEVFENVEGVQTDTSAKHAYLGKPVKVKARDNDNTIL